MDGMTVTAEIPGYGTFTVDGWDLDRAMKMYGAANEVVLADTLVYANAGEVRYQEVYQRSALLVMLCAAGLPPVPSNDALDNMYAILRRTGVISPGPYDCEHCGRASGH
jgi:hypothetical protein